jgi:predicted O-linked N-acetylglucosamine transferase (SPINDLY family)
LDKGNAVSALASCEKQLEISPNDSETWRLLARAALEVGNVERVIDACEFLSADTLLASDYDVLARALAKVGRFDEAERAHANAIECEPDNPSLSQSRIRTLAARHGSAGGYLGRENSAWVAQFTARAAARQERPATAADTDRPLRIAYIGGELYTGPMVELLTPILAAHDAKHFLPFGYTASKCYDMASESLSLKCLRWTKINGVDPVTVGEILRGDGIDIAVDLSGHGIGSQLHMLAQHPVPVCVSWPLIAHPGGAGFDHLLTCETLVPLDQDAGEVAKAVHRLPAAHLAHRPIDAPEAITALPALNQPHVTLGVMAPLAHISETCVKDWAEILADVPNGRIVVANVERLGDPAVTRIYEMATAAGIRDRVDVADLESADLIGYGFFDYFDVLLDPQPNSGFLETSRALWMGVPVLAIAGEGYLGRQAAAALDAAGKPEWVFNTNQARAAGIADLVSDLGQLADLRGKLRNDVARSALCDVRGFTRALEQAFRAM